MEEEVELTLEDLTPRKRKKRLRKRHVSVSSDEFSDSEESILNQEHKCEKIDVITLEPLNENEPHFTWKTNHKQVFCYTLRTLIKASLSMTRISYKDFVFKQPRNVNYF